MEATAKMRLVAHVPPVVRDPADVALGSLYTPPVVRDQADVALSAVRFIPASRIPCMLTAWEAARP